MSQLQAFQDYIRKNGQDLTGEKVPVVLSDEQAKSPNLKFHFGWTIEIGVNKHDHGPHCPSGVNAGSSQQACDCAHENAKQYVSGQDPFFNETFKGMLSNDVAKNFVIRDKSLGSAPDRFVGSDPCYVCHGTGQCDCGTCHGNGSTSCTQCGGSGRNHVTRQDHNNRTVYTTESCSSCYGSGRKTCYTCHGSGKVTCGTCDGGGYLYYSYTIDGDAKRSTKWFFNSTDYHDWTQDYVANSGLDIINGMTDITEIDVREPLEGCTFLYGLTADLPTLQFTAHIDNVDTKMCFAGSHNATHDAGGVYDPAVWKRAQKLGEGNKESDKQVLATPAIKAVIEAHETNTKLALLQENWVSKDIAAAVMSNYQTLLSQLKKQTNAGFTWKLTKNLVHFSYIFIMLAAGVALLLPEVAFESQHRLGLLDHHRFYFGAFIGDFGLFGFPVWANYLIIIAWFALLYHLLPKLYWKQISQQKRWLLTLSIGFVMSYFMLSLVSFSLSIGYFVMEPSNMIVGLALFVGIYMVFFGAFSPQKWHMKLLGGVIATITAIALQFLMMYLDKQMGLLPDNNQDYIEGLANLIIPAVGYVVFSAVEIAALSIPLAIMFTRRRFWLNAKSAISEYNSAVLLKSLKLDK
ncbi:hypothetical protein EXU30_14490 [Shewanella maritima]|uniref:CR-type domain-containing protein n=1 Tax=Shewanella maritima TaxID=2520507 RepID=A0A411PJM3_9GAMM|nr:hypothetical protein [Shewanella maritima]QBF83766.1 hypothetical protein EXU30_14490 [Shewanella maritima]